MESVIDEDYREKLFEYYLNQPIEAVIGKKWIFVCPFCGPLGLTDGKKRLRKGALLWNSTQHSWVFSCAKKGSVDCMNAMTFSHFISALNPALGEAYKRDRWHSGTTGKGHNCGHPDSVVGVSTRSRGSNQIRGRLRNETDIKRTLQY